MNTYLYYLLIVCVSRQPVLYDKGHKRATKEDENYSRRLSHRCFGHHVEVFTVFCNCKSISVMSEQEAEISVPAVNVKMFTEVLIVKRINTEYEFNP